MKVRIGSAILSIVKGDITEQDVTAITNASNDRLWMGSGVAGVIKKKGGEKIEMDAMKQGPVSIGEVVVTDAGDLPIDYIIHAAVMGQDLETNKDYISLATRNTIIKADEMKMKSVAIPAFGTGVGHFPAHEAAQAIIESAVSAIIDTKTLEEVRIVLVSDGIVNIFEEQLKHKFSRR